MVNVKFNKIIGTCTINLHQGELMKEGSKNIIQLLYRLGIASIRYLPTYFYSRLFLCFRYGSSEHKENYRKVEYKRLVTIYHIPIPIQFHGIVLIILFLLLLNT